MASSSNGRDMLKQSRADSLIISGVNERTLSLSSQNQDETESIWKIERNNLLNVAKICVKTLIDGSLKRGRTLDEHFPPLKQFFIVMEHVLKHGLKAKRSILGYRRDFWGFLESLESRMHTIKDMLASIQILPTIKTNTGKSRAWVRLSLMQKLLAEQVQAMIEDKEHLKDWYESYAMLLNEECVVISGLLVGLNVIDCNFDLKGEDLDVPIGIIDLSLYLRDGNYLEKTSPPTDDNFDSDQKVEMILDQKAYLEELNRGLNENALSLQEKFSKLQEEKKLLESELSSLTERHSEVSQESNEVKQENIQLKSDIERRLKLAQADMSVERETYQQSRTGLNEIYMQLKRQLETEVEHRKDIQQDLQVQMAMNQEKEVAMRLLEKDVHDKQDTLMSLRKQLEDVKKINIDINEKNKKIAEEYQIFSEEWRTVQEKFKMLSTEKDALDKEFVEVDAAKSQALETLAQMGFKMGDIESERHTLETNLRIEREWRNGIQKDLEEEKQRVKKLDNEITKLKVYEEENEAMNMELKILKGQCTEQEHTLIEMAEKLTKSQLHVDDMKEATAVMKEQVWKDDKTVVQCQQCYQAFSVARRKHHCRSCGGIFCNGCSDNTMPLPSSAKPVRVCDSCHDKLLARYKAN